MNAHERQELLQLITRRLVAFTAVILLILAAFQYRDILADDPSQRSYLVLLVFMSGLLGGFVSIQQRLPKISLEELRVLSGSWVSITLIPINGGIFALVLMLMFIGHIIQGQLFPVYAKDVAIAGMVDFKIWLLDTYPSTGPDIAKLLFWSFVAGFSERFVPQVIRRAASDTDRDSIVEHPPHDARPARPEVVKP